MNPNDTYSSQSDQDLNNSAQDDNTSVTAANDGNPGLSFSGDMTFGADTGDEQQEDVVDNETTNVIPPQGTTSPLDTSTYQDIGEDISDKEGQMSAMNTGDDDSGDDTTGRLDPPSNDDEKDL